MSVADCIFTPHVTRLLCTSKYFQNLQTGLAEPLDPHIPRNPVYRDLAQQRYAGLLPTDHIIGPVYPESDFPPIFQVFSIPKLSIQRITIQDGATDSRGAWSRVSMQWPNRPFNSIVWFNKSQIPIRLHALLGITKHGVETVTANDDCVLD